MRGSQPCAGSFLGGEGVAPEAGEEVAAEADLVGGVQAGRHDHGQARAPVRVGHAGLQGAGHRALDKFRSHGLEPFLAADAGVDSGLMIAQYTQAGLVSENKRLAAPASVDSIPSSAMQEDHVSMGWHAGRKLRKVVENLRRILAIELVTAARAVEMRAPLQPAPVTGALIARLRAAGVGGVGPDRFLAPELAAAEDLLR